MIRLAFFLLGAVVTIAFGIVAGFVFTQLVERDAYKWRG